VHGNLGLPRWLTDILLCLVELLGLRSGHAYRAAHLQHHRRFPGKDDIEGEAAHGSWFGALVAGPFHQSRILWWALRHARWDRAWIRCKGIGCFVLVLMAFLAWPVTAIPLAYAVLVVLGSWIFPLITSYLPHDAQATSRLTNTRRFRGKVAGILFLQHLYH